MNVNIKVYNLIDFDIYIHTGNYHHNQDNEHFHPSQKVSLFSLVILSFCPSLALPSPPPIQATTDLLSVTVDLLLFIVLCDHIVYQHIVFGCCFFFFF